MYSGVKDFSKSHGNATFLKMLWKMWSRDARCDCEKKSYLQVIFL